MELDRIYIWKAPIMYYCEKELYELMMQDNIIPYFSYNQDDVTYDYNIVRKNVIVSNNTTYWKKTDAYIIDTATKAIRYNDSPSKILVIDALAKDKSILVSKYFRTTDKFMRLILDGVESADIAACVTYIINGAPPESERCVQVQPSRKHIIEEVTEPLIEISDIKPIIKTFACINLWPYYPQIFIESRERTIHDSIAYFSATRRYPQLFKGADAEEYINDSKYLIRSCKHFSNEAVCERCGRDDAVKIEWWENYCLMEHIISDPSTIEYRRSIPSGDKNIVPTQRKYLIFCRNKEFADYIAALCAKHGLSVSFDRITREHTCNVKILTNMKMADKADYNSYTHIVFIANKKRFYMRIIRKALNLFRPFNLYLHII